MKTLRLYGIASMFFLMAGGISAFGQANLEVPGDNFSLEGALELFKKSASPQEFEKLLNSPDSKVNNLDLNGDGYVDYVRVLDREDGNVHAFILQAVIAEKEFQDVAVIELEKLDNGKAVLQITGDEDVYGIETIIEPTSEVRVYAGASTSRTVVNVWAWPAVQYVYGPRYSVWVSPWSWAYRPIWWRTWTPVAYYVYDPWWRPYRSYYSVCYTHRIAYAPRIYRPYRTTSVIVYNRNHTQIAHYRSSHKDYYHSRDRYAANRGYDRHYTQHHQNYTRDHDVRHSYDNHYNNPGNNYNGNHNGGQHERNNYQRNGATHSGSNDSYNRPTGRDLNTPTRSDNQRSGNREMTQREVHPNSSVEKRPVSSSRTNTTPSRSSNMDNVRRNATKSELPLTVRSSGSRNEERIQQHSSGSHQGFSTPERHTGTQSNSRPERSVHHTPTRMSGGVSDSSRPRSGGSNSSHTRRGR